MKLTRRQLRRLIAEAIDEGRNIIVDPEGEAFVASDLYSTGTAKDAQTTHPKLINLRQSGLAGQRQARQLAVDLDMQPDLTSAEAAAVEMGKQKAMMPDTGFEYPIDKEALYIAMKSRSEGVLKRLGFKYVEDLDISPKDYNDYFGDQFRFQAQALGCDVDDLAFVETDLGDQPGKTTYDVVLDINKSRFKLPESMKTIPGDTGEFGSNSLHDLDGLLVLFTDHMDGYYTATICGK